MNALAEIFYIAWGSGDAATPNIAVPTRVDLLELVDTLSVRDELFVMPEGFELTYSFAPYFSIWI